MLNNISHVLQLKFLLLLKYTPPFLWKKLVGDIGNHWSVTWAGPLLGSQWAPTDENFWIPPCTLKVRASDACSGIRLLFFEIYKGVYTCKSAFSTRASHLSSPSAWLVESFLKTILENSVEGEPKIHSLKFSSRNGDWTRNLCVCSPMR